MAGFYRLAYLGLIAPIFGIGIATQYLTAATPVAWFAVLLLCMLAAVSVLQRISAKRDMRSTTLRTT
jgi:hypothetical protein